MRTAQKQDTTEAAFNAIFVGIGGFFKSVFYGIKSLKTIWHIVALLLMGAASVIVYIKRSMFFEVVAPIYVQWLIYVTLLALPILYLAILGSFQGQATKAYYKIFEDIKFAGKDGKYPFLLFKKQDGKKLNLGFKSMIPLETWEKSIKDLETALDCNILSIEPMTSKKKVRLTTVSSEYKMPTEILWSDDKISPDDGVLVVGENALEQIKFDLNKVPHVLVAGQTGSGKSVILRAMFKQLAAKGAASFMFDFKGGVEFGIEYEAFGEVATEREKALEILELLVEENSLRLATFRPYGVKVKNIKDYNRLTGEKLSRIGVFCDEIAEMLDKKGVSKEEKALMEQIEGRFSTLARLSRATGINLILGAQRPDANILTGQIKNNVPVRICGRFTESAASEIVLDNTRASKLPETSGRFMFKAGADTLEFQAYYFIDETMLGEAPDIDYHVLSPRLARRMERCRNNSPKEGIIEQLPEKPPAINANGSQDNEIKLDFNFRKAVNK